MSYNKNTNHESIVRQSMMKAAVDYAAGKDLKITEVIGIGMAFTEYALYGTYETALIVEKKLGQG